MSNEITEHGGGGAVGPAGRLDVRAMMRHYLAPFQAAEPWRNTLATIEKHHSGIDCRQDGSLYALDEVDYIPGQLARLRAHAIIDAVAIREAIGPIGPVWDAADALDEAMAPPPEEVVRRLLGAMVSFFRAKPNEGSAIYIDGLVWLLMEPESGEPVSAPAIAAAIREAWQTSTFPPSGHELLGLCQKHQERIERVRSNLSWISDAQISAYEVLSKLAPEKLPKPREWSDEDLDEIFGAE